MLPASAFQGENGRMSNDAIKVLDEQACLEKLRGEKLGRLVVRRKDDMDIFPVNFVLDESDEAPCLYFRSAEGAKLFSVNLNHDVLFEIDHLEGEEHAWSVVVKGTAAVVETFAEIRHADTLDLKPWVPTLKYNYVRINIDSLSGRAFDLGEEPERY